MYISIIGNMTITELTATCYVVKAESITLVFILSLKKKALLIFIVCTV